MNPKYVFVMTLILKSTLPLSKDLISTYTWYTWCFPVIFDFADKQGVSVNSPVQGLPPWAHCSCPRLAGHWILHTSPATERELHLLSMHWLSTTTAIESSQKTCLSVHHNYHLSYILCAYDWISVIERSVRTAEIGEGVARWYSIQRTTVENPARLDWE